MPSSGVLTAKSGVQLLFILCQKGHSRDGHAQIASARSCFVSNTAELQECLGIPSTRCQWTLQKETRLAVWYKSVATKRVFTNKLDYTARVLMQLFISLLTGIPDEIICSVVQSI